MSIPPSVVKLKTGTMTFTDNVDRCNYTLEELTRGALRDVGKYLRQQIRQNLPKRTGKMRRHVNAKVAKNPHNGIVRLRIGIGEGGWYGIFQELGTKYQPKQAIIQTTVKDNIRMIQQIEGKYLSAIEDEMQALSLIDERDDESYDQQDS